MAFLKSLCRVFFTAVAVVLCLQGFSNTIADIQSGYWLSIGTLLFYSLLLILFIIRRPSQKAVVAPKHLVFALCGTFSPFLLTYFPSDAPFLPVPLLIVLPLHLLGMVLSLIAVANLGRGFGIFAALRLIKTEGLYRLIRHPLYTGEAIWLLAIILTNLTVYSALLYIVQVGCQIQRMKSEEELLSEDPTYAEYLSRVKYRMIPGVF